MSTGIPFVDLWWLRGLWWPFEELSTFWVSVENLRSEDLGYLCAFSWLFEDFADLLRDFLKTWGPDALRTLRTFLNFWWLLVDHLRTVFRKFWGLFEYHLMNIWGTFDDHRILTTLITYWGLWYRLEYLLWTSEDFEGFDDLLRNLRTFWGSVDNLRSEDLGYLLCISWLFEDFADLLRNIGRPDDLVLSERWRTFQELLMTSCGTFEDCFLGIFEDSVRTIWWPFEELLTTTGFWGRW